MPPAVPYEIGDHVVYPRHGPGRVVDKEDRAWDGEQVPYLHLELDDQDLEVWVPESGVEEIGVRPPVSHDEVDEVFELLADHDVRVPQNFSRRLKMNQRRLTEGDVQSVALVVRDLAVRRHRRHLSPTEKTIWDRACAQLATELALALDIDHEEATARMEAALPS